MEVQVDDMFLYKQTLETKTARFREQLENELPRTSIC